MWRLHQYAPSFLRHVGLAHAVGVGVVLAVKDAVDSRVCTVHARTNDLSSRNLTGPLANDCLVPG